MVMDVYLLGQMSNTPLGRRNTTTRTRMMTNSSMGTRPKRWTISLIFESVLVRLIVFGPRVGLEYCPRAY